MKRQLKMLVLITIALLTGVISGCNTRYQAPVGATQTGPTFQTDGRIHRVNAGETLYSIAWVYDLNYQQLASLNGLAAPYDIYAGQELNVDPRTRRTQNTSATTSRVTVNAVPSTRPITVNRIPTNSIPTNALNWLWPTQGEVIGRFVRNSSNNKGINIAGVEGQTIVAAEAGEVVYAGRGLLRYGDMIIIKHNDQFLSAYAHNSELGVREGDRVVRGQKIAELGSTGINRNMLHFEIRLSGAPVDPLTYLPAQ